MLTHAEWQAIQLSLLVGITAVACSLVPGVALSYTLARFSFRGKTIVETALNLPLILPPVVTGYLLLLTLGRNGLLGNLLENYFGIRLVFDWKGAAIASAVVAFPLMVRSMRVAFAMVDLRLEQAARTLGASWWNAFWTVTLPLARHGVIAGCLLAFARSLGEFGATIMIAGNIPGETRTVPLFIYTLLQSPGGAERAQRLVLISIALGTLALVLSDYLERRTNLENAA